MRESYRILLKENCVGNSQSYMSLIFVGHEKAIGKSFDIMKKNIKNLLEKLD